MATGAAEAVPAAVAPPPRHPRFPLVDGLRAVAVLCVVAVHVVTSLGQGDSILGRLAVHLNLGVTIFFLISGFLLYRPFIAHRAGGPASPRAVDYLRRRALRIFPAYWLVVTALILLPGITATGDGRWLEQYALVFTLWGPAGWTCADCGLIQGWSLVAELTFYLSLPLYVLATAKLLDGRPTRVWLSAELALLALLSLGSVWLQFVVHDGSPPQWIGGSVLAYGLWFALGMALAALSVALTGSRRETARPLGAAAAATCWAGAVALYVVLVSVLPNSFVIFDPGDQFLAFAGFGLVSLLLLAPAVLGPDSTGPLSSVLAARPVAWLGLISYGIFLWHIVVLRKLSGLDVDWTTITLLLATLAVTIPIAALSYYALERPLLRLKYRRRSGPSGNLAEAPAKARGPGA